jgi:hypothetical protein
MACCIANSPVDGPLYWLAEGGAGPRWRSAGAWIPAGPARQARISALTITHTVIGPVAELGPLYEPPAVVTRGPDDPRGGDAAEPPIEGPADLIGFLHVDPDLSYLDGARHLVGARQPGQWWESVSETLFTPAVTPAIPGRAGRARRDGRRSVVDAAWRQRCLQRRDDDRRLPAAQRCRAGSGGIGKVTGAAARRRLGTDRRCPWPAGSGRAVPAGQYPRSSASRSSEPGRSRLSSGSSGCTAAGCGPDGS